MKKILVPCTGNSCRSQMAHGYLEKFSDENWMVRSAGVETHGINPFAIGVMAEDDVFIHNHTSDLVSKFDDEQFDIVLTVCDNAKESCPFFPNTKQVIHHSFSDPSHKSGTAKELIEAFRATRDEIKAFCVQLLKEHN